MPKKTLSTEEKEAISEWFCTQYWPTYPGKWCRGGKGSRSTCLNLMLDKWQPDEAERRRILGNLKAQILHDRKVPDGQRKWWKMCDTYTRNGLWEDEIEPLEDPIKNELPKCSCGQPVHGPKFNLCQDCLLKKVDPWRQKRIETLKDMGLYIDGESVSEVIGRCRVRGSDQSGSFSLKKLFESSRQFLTENADSNGQKISQNEDGGEPTTPEEWFKSKPIGSKEWFDENMPGKFDTELKIKDRFE